MRLTRFRTWLPVALFAAWVVTLGGQAHAGGPPHAPPRVTLRDVAKRLMCFNIQVPPEVLVKVHDAYLDRYVEQFRTLDEEYASSPEGKSVGQIIPGTRAVRHTSLLRAQSLVVGLRLVDEYMGELKPHVAPEQQSMLSAFHDDLQTMLIMSSMEGDGNRFGDILPPDDIMAWLLAYVNVDRLPAEQRATFAERCAAHAGARRAAALALSRAVEAARLRGGAKADELGIAGRPERPELSGDAASQRFAQETWNGLEHVLTASRLTAKDMAPFAQAQIEAWKAIAPFLSCQERATMLNSFVSVLLYDRSDVGRADNVRVTVDGIIYGGGISVARTALALPGLTDEQRERTRAALNEWLSARAAALEKALLAANNEDQRAPALEAIEKLDADHLAKLAEVTGAWWLDTLSDWTRSDLPETKAERSAIPKREELSLRREDDAAFPLPTSDDGWRDTSWVNAWTRQNERSRGLPMEPARDLATRGANALRLTDAQRLVWAQLADDFLATWDEQVAPRIEAARSGDRAPDPRQARASAWQGAREAWSAFCAGAAAALPGQAGHLAHLWAEAQRAETNASFSVAPGLSGYALVPPIVPAAAFSPRTEPEWQLVAADILSPKATGIVDRFEALCHAERALRLRTPGQHDATTTPGAVPASSWPDAYRDYLAAANEAIAAVAAALPEEARVAWQRSINELRNRHCYQSVLGVVSALPQDERAATLRRAVLAEQERLDSLGDLAFAILSGGTDHLANGLDVHGREDSLRQSRASVYIELARDRVYLATWRLAQQLPDEARSRLTYIGVVTNLKRPGAPPPAASSNTQE